MLRVDACASGQPFAAMTYRAAGVAYRRPLRCVVNCSRFFGAGHVFLAVPGQLMQNRLCPNHQRGLLVNDDFEASPGFCVVRP